jgi:phosphoglycerate kinase
MVSNSMKYLSEAKFNFKGKTVLLRVDTDVDLKKENGKFVVDEDYRLKTTLPAIHFLQENGAEKIIMIGHIGRPKGNKVTDLSMAPVADWFSDKFSKNCQLTDIENVKKGKKGIFLLENIRFYPEEEKNDLNFSKKLSHLADVYINEAFGVSHRDHASIIGITSFLPSFLGLRFEGEIKALSLLLKNATRPLVFVLGGSKKGKLDYIDFLSSWADQLLIGGMLPTRISQEKIKTDSKKVIIGRLNKQLKDIDEETISIFKTVLQSAATIVWAGPMGVYEEVGNRKGTEAIAREISKTTSFKVAGGGDTHRVLSWFGLWQGFDFVSVGGGAMLQFLQNKSLTGMAKAR